MNAFKLWLSNHSISAKTAIAGWVFIVGLWAESDAFRSYVLGIYNSTPKPVHNFIAGVIVPVLILWRTQRKTTVTAEVSPGQAATATAAATVVKDK